MNDLVGWLILGTATGALYAVAASGLVVTYTTSGIFNFAHGAVAMVCAFVYWQLSSPAAWDLPVPVALVLTLGVFAPGFGWLIDKVLMRRLADAMPITRLVVPIGLTVALIQGATVIWPPTRSRSLPFFFDGEVATIAGVGIAYHQFVVLAAAIAVAVGLRILLYRTRTGVAMRAVVDSRELAALNGVSPDRVSSLSWALGCSLAGLSGVLVAPILALDQTQLTLLVINAYAAAMVGRLRSLPLTALGALILGLLREGANRWSSDLLDWTDSESLPGWLPGAIGDQVHRVAGWITVDTVPALMLFVVLLAIPQEKAELFSQRRNRSQVPNPSWTKVAVASVLLVAVALVLPAVFEGRTLDAIGYGFALGIVALSLVPLTGYGGQVSLAPLAFAGIGALAMGSWGADGNPLALVPVAAVCAVVGALMALPALRLKGLYLALATMAFAVFCEKAIFASAEGFSQGDTDFDRLSIGGWSATSDRSGLLVLALCFVLIGVLVAALRRGPFGRRLQAMKDSPAACATLGLNTTLLKLEVFALSAAIAGVGGAMLGMWRGKAGLEQFALLQGSLPGLPLVLMAVVGGIAAVAGALLGGVLLAVMPEVGRWQPSLEDLMVVLPGLAGISLASNPDGAIAQTVKQVGEARQRRADRRSGASSRSAAARLLDPPKPDVVPERWAAGASLDPAHLAAVDAELGLDWGRCRADP